MKRWLNKAALYAETNGAGLRRTVQLELDHLLENALEQLKTPLEDAEQGVGQGACLARAALQRLESIRAEFPVEELRALREPRTAGNAVLASLAAHWGAQHEQLRRRLRWLVDPELTRSQLSSLDPKKDADQLWCFVKYDFRAQVLHAGWANAIKRVAQNQAMSTFIHATGHAERNPLKRTEDTLYFLYYRFNWGRNSLHGRQAVEAVNQIHSRYTIPQEGMKFVLLDSAFSVLDAIDALGHRKLTQVEREGYFQATIALGHEMNVEGLSEDLAEMERWFRGRCEIYSEFAPQKRRLWFSISDSFDQALNIHPVAARTRRTLERIAMDDSYRSSLGFRRPSSGTVLAAKGLMKGLATLRRLLPTEPYVESLQPCYTYPTGPSLDQLGERDHSESMPRRCPFSGDALRANGKAGPVAAKWETVGWDEVQKHRTADDLWLVFDGHVFDVSAFAKNHPGGLNVLLSGHGRDLSEEYERAQHSEMAQVFALNFRIAKIGTRA